MYEDGISRENMNKTNKMIKCPGVVLACHFVCRSRVTSRRACSPVNRRARWLAGNPRLDWSSACTKMPTNWSSSSLFKRVCHYVFELSWKYKCSFIFWDVPLETAFCFDFTSLFIGWFRFVENQLLNSLICGGCFAVSNFRSNPLPLADTCNGRLVSCNLHKLQTLFHG